MNNLKRVLSLALASVMVLGMMVVGASATDFPDDDKITHQGAVSTLASLGIMIGDDTGFRPEDTLTRAEAAKMLAFIQNKGRNVNYGVKTEPTFTDIGGKWFEPWVEYAYAMGIVKGNGDGTFNPDGTLRTVELLRMVLNMMGYEEGSKGSDWELQTIVKAEELALVDLEDETIDPTGKINRDNAAQVIYNSLSAPMSGNNTYPATSTTLEETGKYTIAAKEGFEAAMADVVGPTYGSFTEAYLLATAVEITAGTNAKLGTHFVLNPVKQSVTVTETKAETLGHKFLSMQEQPITVTTIAVNNGKYVVNGTYTVDEDPSALLGLKATAVVKLNADGTVALTHGINATGKILYTGLVKDVTKTDAEKKILTIAGTEYGYNDSYAIKTWNTDTATTLAANNGWDELTVISNSNGKIDRMLIKTVTVADVTNVANDGKVTIAGVNLGGDDNTAQPIDPTKNTVAEGLEEEDWVIVTTDVAGKYTVAKAPIVEGVRYTKANGNKSYVIGGVTYKAEDGVITANLGDTLNLVAYQGYVFATPAVEGASTAMANVSDVVYALKVNTAMDNDASDFGAAATKWWLKVQIQKQDNTKGIIEVGSVNGTALTAQSTTSVVSADTLYIMTTDDKGVIDLTAVAASKFDNFADGASVTGAGIADGKLGDTRIAEDAVVFVKLGTTVECLSGKALADKKVTAAAGNFASGSATYTKTESNGYDYVKLGLLVGGNITEWPGAVSDAQYGYIVTSATKEYLAKGEKGATKDGVYNTVELFNGETTEWYLIDKDTTVTDYTAGSFITFKVKDNNEIDTTDLAVIALAAGEVKAYDGKMVKIDSTEYDTTANTTLIFYVDSSAKKGAEAVTIKLAKTGTNNVATGSNGGTTIIVVDVKNEIKNLPAAPCTHASASKTPAVPATCTGTGTSAYWTCSDCDKTFADNNGVIGSEIASAPSGDIAATGHTYTWSTVSDGGDHDGEHMGTCSVCTATVEGHIVYHTAGDDVTGCDQTGCNSD